MRTIAALLFCLFALSGFAQTDGHFTSSKEIITKFTSKSLNQTQWLLSVLNDGEVPIKVNVLLKNPKPNAFGELSLFPSQYNLQPGKSDYGTFFTVYGVEASFEVWIEGQKKPDDESASNATTSAPNNSPSANQSDGLTPSRNDSGFRDAFAKSQPTDQTANLIGKDQQQRNNTGKSSTPLTPPANESSTSTTANNGVATDQGSQQAGQSDPLAVTISEIAPNFRPGTYTGFVNVVSEARNGQDINVSARGLTKVKMTVTFKNDGGKVFIGSPNSTTMTELSLVDKNKFSHEFMVNGVAMNYLYFFDSLGSCKVDNTTAQNIGGDHYDSHCTTSLVLSN